LISAPLEKNDPLPVITTADISSESFDFFRIAVKSLFYDRMH